jgi:cation diffusion facilitator family transporter
MKLSTDQPTVQTVLWRVLVLNAGVAAAKIIVGVLTGTIAIVADGIHSAVDGASNVVGLIAGRIASQPPDEDHPYGHERFETIGALAIGGLLLLTAWEVLQVAVERLISGASPDVGPLQFAVLFTTLAVNIVVAAYERREARRLKSELLSADADHTASDIWVTISVIVSLIAVEFGLLWMDAFTALLIVIFIGFIAYRILRRTTRVLVDRAPIDATRLEAVVRETPGVKKVVRARSRGAQDAVHVDIDVALAPVVNANAAQDIADALRDRLRAAFPAINEVRVQIESETLEDVSALVRVRAIADTLGLSVHEVITVSTEHGRHLEMHVEVRPDLNLRDAHAQIDQLEHRLKENDGITDVVTHIEPAATGTTLPASSPAALTLTQNIMQQLSEHFPQGNWHAEKLHHEGNGYTFSVHCHLPGDLSIETAHRFAEGAELHLRSTFSQLHRVTIHTEPFTAS